MARLTQVGADADVLLARVYDRFGEQVPPQADVLRRLLIQHFLTDARGRLRPRTERDGLPPSRLQIESPYETEARFVRRGFTRWTGYHLHVTETCDENRVNIVTDVATWVSSADSQALPGIHARLKKRRLLPGRAPGRRRLRLRRRAGRRRPELQDRAGGADREEQLPASQSGTTGSPSRTSSSTSTAARSPARTARSAATGTRSRPWPRIRWSGSASASAAPARRRPSALPARPGPSTPLPRRIHELQERNRDDQGNSAWRRLYALRSGTEGTMAEFINGHRARRCRYRGLAKTHVQHVLTAIAVNIERLSQQEPANSDYRPRPPTAFQQYLDAHDLPRPLWWRQGK